MAVPSAPRKDGGRRNPDTHRISNGKGCLFRMKTYAGSDLKTLLFKRDGAPVANAADITMASDLNRILNSLCPSPIF